MMKFIAIVAAVFALCLVGAISAIPMPPTATLEERIKALEARVEALEKPCSTEPQSWTPHYGQSTPGASKPYPEGINENPR